MVRLVAGVAPVSGDEGGRREPKKEPRLREVMRRILREAEDIREEVREELAQEEEAPSGAAPPPSAPPPTEEEGPEQRRKGPRSEARDFLWGLLETGNKTRAELIRLLAREFRFYLEAAELDQWLRDLATHYSLEVHASVHLKPLGDAASTEKPVRVGLRRRKEEEAGE